MGDQVVVVDVREAGPDDAPAIAAVLNAVIASGAAVAFNRPVTVESERRYLAEFSSRGVFHVALDSDAASIIGFQSVEPFAASPGAFDHVGSIGTYVDIEHRRRGVAAALFEATLAVARIRGFEKIMAFVREDNAAGQAVYARHGFRVIGTAARHAKIDGRYIDEVILERLL